MRLLVNYLSFYVMITCMLLFENQQVIGLHIQFERSTVKTIKQEDGTTLYHSTKPRHLDYESSWSDDDDDEPGLVESLNEVDIIEKLHQNYGPTIRKIKTLKNWITTESDLKRIGSFLFKDGKHLVPPMESGLESEPLETSDPEDSVTESKQSIAKMVSAIGTSLISRKKSRKFFLRKDPEYIIRETPKSEETSETESKPLITTSTTFEDSLKSRGKYLEQYRQKGSEYFVLNAHEDPKSSDSKTLTTEGKQFASPITSTFETSFIAKEEYLGLPMQKESENIDQGDLKTSDTEDSVIEDRRSFTAIKTLFINPSTNKMRFSLSKKQISDNSTHEGSKSNHLEAVENDSPKSNNEEGSEPSTPGAREIDAKLKNSFTSKFGKFMKRQNSNQNSNH